MWAFITSLILILSITLVEFPMLAFRDLRYDEERLWQALREEWILQQVISTSGLDENPGVRQLKKANIPESFKGEFHRVIKKWGPRPLCRIEDFLVGPRLSASVVRRFVSPSLLARLGDHREKAVEKLRDTMPSKHQDGLVEAFAEYGGMNFVAAKKSPRMWKATVAVGLRSAVLALDNVGRGVSLGLLGSSFFYVFARLTIDSFLSLISYSSVAGAFCGLVATQVILFRDSRKEDRSLILALTVFVIVYGAILGFAAAR